MKVLFDTNLWISFMIGKRLSSLANVLNRQDVEVYVSEQLLGYYFFEMVYDVCQVTDITVQADSPIRDIKDLYLLSIAESVPVDFIVSGDNDLIDLGSHADIPILKYANFVSMLSAMEKGNN